MSSKNPWENPDQENPFEKKNQKRSNNNERSKNGESDIFEDIGNFFKKKSNNRGGENSDGSGGSAGGFFPSLWLVLGAGVALYLASGFYQVQHDERSVILRFGKWNRTVGPGLQYALPYPFEEAILQKVTTVKQIDIGAFFQNPQGESLMLTGDSNLANISFSVLWKVREMAVEDYLFNARRPEVTVRAVAESVMREIVGQHPFAYVQTEGRADIQKMARENLQAIMDEYKMGVDILRVELQRVEPPLSVVDAFRDVERAQAEQQSEKNKAEAYDRDTRARTRGRIAQIINEGESHKREIIECAKGVTARFLSVYSQYKLSPKIVAKRLYIDTMREIFGGSDKVIVDGDTDTIQHLPIDQLWRKMPTNVAAENQEKN